MTTPILRSYQVYGANDQILTTAAEAIQDALKDAKSSSKVQRVALRRQGHRQDLEIGDIYVIPASVCNKAEDFPTVLLYANLRKHATAEGMVEFQMGTLVEPGEISSESLQALKDVAFTNAKGESAPLIVFAPSWSNPSDYLSFVYESEADLIPQLREIAYSAPFNPSLSSVFDQLKAVDPDMSPLAVNLPSTQHVFQVPASEDPDYPEFAKGLDIAAPEGSKKASLGRRAVVRLTAADLPTAEKAVMDDDELGLFEAVDQQVSDAVKFPAAVAASLCTAAAASPSDIADILDIPSGQKKVYTVGGITFTVYYDQQEARGDMGQSVPGMVSGDYEVWVGPVEDNKNLLRQHVSPGKPRGMQQSYAAEKVVTAILNYVNRRPRNASKQASAYVDPMPMQGGLGLRAQPDYGEAGTCADKTPDLVDGPSAMTASKRASSFVGMVMAIKSGEKEVFRIEGRSGQITTFVVYFDAVDARGDMGGRVPGMISGEYEVCVSPTGDGEVVGLQNILRQHVSPGKPNGAQQIYAAERCVEAMTRFVRSHSKEAAGVTTHQASFHIANTKTKQVWAAEDVDGIKFGGDWSDDVTEAAAFISKEAADDEIRRNFLSRGEAEVVEEPCGCTDCKCKKEAASAPGPWVVIDEATGEVKATCKNRGEATKIYNRLNAPRFRGDEGAPSYEMKAKSYHDEMQPKGKEAKWKRASNWYNPGSVLEQFAPDLAGSRVDSPFLNQQENEAGYINPFGAPGKEAPMDNTGMGLNQQISDGAGNTVPLRQENNFYGPDFARNFYAPHTDISPGALTLKRPKGASLKVAESSLSLFQGLSLADPEKDGDYPDEHPQAHVDERAAEGPTAIYEDPGVEVSMEDPLFLQMDQFVKQILAAYASQLISAFQVTSRPISLGVPFEDTLDLADLLRYAGGATVSDNARDAAVTQLIAGMTKLNDGQRRLLLENAFAQAAVWCNGKGGSGGFNYEVYVRATELGESTMKITVVTGQKGA